MGQPRTGRARPWARPCARYLSSMTAWRGTPPLRAGKSTSPSLLALRPCRARPPVIGHRVFSGRRLLSSNDARMTRGRTRSRAAVTPSLGTRPWGRLSHGRTRSRFDVIRLERPTIDRDRNLHLRPMLRNGGQLRPGIESRSDPLGTDPVQRHGGRAIAHEHTPRRFHLRMHALSLARTQRYAPLSASEIAFRLHRRFHRCKRATASDELPSCLVSVESEHALVRPSLRV